MKYPVLALLYNYPVLAEFVLARNIANTDEVDRYLESLHSPEADLEPLNKWLNGAMRKFLINKYDKTRPYHASEKDPAWMQGKEDLEKVVLDDALTGKIQHVVDYIKNLITTNPQFKLNNFQAEEAFKQADEWVKKLQKKKIEEEVEGTDFKVLKDYGDGYKWVDVISQNGLAREGKLMGHCVGGYWDRVKAGKERIVSLRDGKNEPHATLEITGKKLNQIKGKQNKRVIDDYMPYVLDLLNAKVVPFSKIEDWDLKMNGLLETEKGYIGINQIPPGTTLMKSLNLKEFENIKLPEDLTIKGDLTVSDGELQKNLKVTGKLDLTDNQAMTQLPPGLDVKDLDLFGSAIESIPAGIKIRGSLNGEFSQISKLPDGLTIPKDLQLSDTPIKELPKKLKVGNELDLMNTEIRELPKDLKCETIFLDDDWEEQIEVPENLKEFIY